MNHSQLTELIYDRHIQALRRVTADGTWIDESAARMALWLALTEQAERLGSEPAPQVKLAALGYWWELARLAEYLRDKGHLDGATEVPLKSPAAMAVPSTEPPVPAPIQTAVGLADMIG
jgi:hypothetical protein